MLLATTAQRATIHILSARAATIAVRSQPRWPAPQRWYREPSAPAARALTRSAQRREGVSFAPT